MKNRLPNAPQWVYNNKITAKARNEYAGQKKNISDGGWVSDF